MSVRGRPPTDEQGTAVHDGPPDRPTIKGTGFEPGPASPPGSDGDASPAMPAPEVRSEPIRVISMKASGEADAPEERQVKQHQPRLRQLSEVSPQRHRVATPPGGLGYLAPPRDPREVRTRRRRELVIWGSVAVIIAGAVTLGVWFLAGM